MARGCGVAVGVEEYIPEPVVGEPVLGGDFLSSLCYLSLCVFTYLKTCGRALHFLSEKEGRAVFQGSVFISEFILAQVASPKQHTSN